MVSAFLLPLILQSAPLVLVREKVAGTNLSLLRPDSEKVKVAEGKTTLEWTRDGIVFSLVSEKATGTLPSLGKRYEEVLKRERARFNSRSLAIDNMAPVPTGQAFGVTESIGFIMETGARNGPAYVGWQRFVEDGTVHEIFMEWPERQTLLAYQIFCSPQFTLPGTDQWSFGEVARTGIRSSLSSGFSPGPLGPSQITGYTLASPGLPAVALGFRSSFRELKVTNAAEAEQHVRNIWARLISDMFSGQYKKIFETAALSFQVEEVQREGVKMTRVIGEARQENKSIMQIDGYFRIDPDEVRFFSVIYLPQDPDSKAMAERLLSSLRLMPDPPKSGE